MSLVSSIKFTSIYQNHVFSFDGTSFKTEPSSKYPHDYVYALGSYRNSPFVTGHMLYTFSLNKDALKTEILDYKAKNWTEAKDYPFADYGKRYAEGSRF